MNLTSTAAVTSRLDISAVAKLVRADIKAAIASGELPAGARSSVRIDRCSVSERLTVVLTIPGVVRCSASECEAGRASGLSKPWLSRVAYLAEGVVEGIVARYALDCRHLSVRVAS